MSVDSRFMDPARAARIPRIQHQVIDALARNSALGAVALRAWISSWTKNDLNYAIDSLVEGGQLLREGRGRSTVYRLVEQERNRLLA